MHNTIRFQLIPHRHVYRVGDQFGPQLVGHRLADLSRFETIDQRCQIQPALPSPDIDDVADDLDLGPVGGESRRTRSTVSGPARPGTNPTRGDTTVLAHILRTDRHLHRQVPG
jgi:hypothetical protein